jgi:hypothetical protein
VIEHIDMLSMAIQYHPYTVIPTLLGSDFGFPLGWENTLRLKFQHIVALSQQKTKGRETTLELGIANLIGVAVRFAIKLGVLL